MTDLSLPASSAVIVATAFVIAAVSTPILEHLAPRLGLLDHPGGRKDHGRAVPLVGGIAVFLGFFGASCIGGIPVSPWLLVSMALMVCLGMIDDIFEIAPKRKLAGQLVVASLLTFASGAVIVSFGNLVGTGDLHPGRLGGVLTVFCLVGLVNALNMIDGLDGLAGGLGLVSALALAWAASLAGQNNAFFLLIVLAAGIAGFLLFNLRLPWQPAARVFLGDAGSNLLGLTLAYFAVWMSQDSRGQPTVLPPMSAVWLIGLPILDTLTVMARRIADRRSPFSAGRDHLHHILLALGLGHAATLWTMLAFAAVLALCGMMGWRMGVPDWAMLWSAVAILIVYYAATRKVLNALAGVSAGKLGQRAADQAP
ncbi:MAG TPA: MraY family glycosyltransferase [Burkholderiales bacterium]|nr:MraY family glycosyltransferase [Burkholderiales bacterium]